MLRLLALGVGGATVASIALTAFLWAAVDYRLPPVRFFTHTATLITEWWMVATYAAVGVILMLKRPSNAVGWLCAASGLVTSVSLLGAFYVTYALHEVLFTPRGGEPLLPAAYEVAWVNNAAFLPLLTTLLVSMFVRFPDGRVPSGGWTRVIGVTMAGSALYAVALAFTPGRLTWFPLMVNRNAAPDGISWLAAVAYVVGAVLMVVGVLGAAASVIVRYRRGRERERQQLKWVAYALALMASVGVLFMIVISVADEKSSAGDLVTVTMMVAATLIPLAAGVAILRHKLFDIDLIINRTLVWVLLTSISSGTYAASVAVLQRIFVSASGHRSDIAVVLSTLLVAGLFTPMKRVIEGGVDRRFRSSPAGDGAASSSAAVSRRVLRVDRGRLEERLELVARRVLAEE